MREIQPKASGERGLTMVEMMIALAVMLGLCAAAFSYLNNVESYRTNLTRVSTRDAIAKRIETQLQTHRSVNFSGMSQFAISDGNAKLRDCLSETIGNCTVTKATQQVSFALFVDQGGAGALKLTGTDAAPVFYDTSGRPNCVKGEPGCPAYKAVTYFWANCAKKGQASCPQGMTISTRYQVTPLTSGKKDGKVLPAHPPEPEFSAQKSKFAVTTTIRKTIQSNQSCPVGAIQVGTTSTGALNCVCAFNNAPSTDPVTGGLKCNPTSKTCQQGQVVVGIKIDGNPDCRCVKPICQAGWTDFNDDAAKCPNGGWLEQLDMGYCYQESGGGKSATNIGCQRNRGKCCRYQIVTCT